MFPSLIGHMKSSLLLLPLLLCFASACSKPDSSELFLKAQQAMKQNDTTAAIQHLQDIADYHADSPQAPEALYLLGSLYLNEKREAARAVPVFERLYEKYASSEYAHRALFISAFTYANELNDADKAKSLYELYLKSYPDSVMAESARFELAHIGQSAEEVLKGLQNPDSASPHASK